jgi:hypothetical protein
MLKWRNAHFLSAALLGILLILLTTLVVVAYYINHSQPESLADTTSYLYVVNLIQTHGQLVNYWRLPGYPLFIVFIYALAGQGNLAAVSIAQAVLFVMTVLELYVLGILVLRRAWFSFLVGLLVGPNLVLLSYVKPIMTEALALWLLTSLALAVVAFLATSRLLLLWLATLCLLALVFTRPEWIYLPILLFIYILLVARRERKGDLHRLLLHSLAGVALLYALLGGYLYVNATQNHFPQLTWIDNMNALGKVLQYNMQNEAPPQDAQYIRIIDSYVRQGILDPYRILAHQPLLSNDHAEAIGDISRSIIEHHPIEFLAKSVPVFFSSLTDFHMESAVIPAGPYGSPLQWLQNRFGALYRQGMILFPICALLWLALFCWRAARTIITRHRGAPLWSPARLRNQGQSAEAGDHKGAPLQAPFSSPVAKIHQNGETFMQGMGVILLLCIYGLFATVVGAYRGYDYMRIHVLFDPLMILVIVGTILLGVLLPVRFLLSLRV